MRISARATNTKMEISSIRAIPLVHFRATTGAPRRDRAAPNCGAAPRVAREILLVAQKRIARKPAPLSQTRAIDACTVQRAIIHSEVAQRAKMRDAGRLGPNCRMLSQNR